MDLFNPQITMLMKFFHAYGFFYAYWTLLPWLFHPYETYSWACSFSCFSNISMFMEFFHAYFQVCMNFSCILDFLMLNELLNEYEIFLCLWDLFILTKVYHDYETFPASQTFPSLWNFQCIWNIFMATKPFHTFGTFLCLGKFLMLVFFFQSLFILTKISHASKSLLCLFQAYGTFPSLWNIFMLVEIFYVWKSVPWR